MRAASSILVAMLVVPLLAHGEVPQFYVTYSKDNAGDGNFKVYYAVAAGNFSLIVPPKLLIDSPTAAYAVVSNKGTKLAYVERDPFNGTYQLYHANLSQPGTITGGPWKLTNDARYSIQYPTIVYDKRFGFTRMSASGGPPTEEVYVSILHRKNKTVLKWMKPATNNSVQDTQAFMMGVLRGVYYVRDGSIYFRPVNSNGPKFTEKLVLAGSPPSLVYSYPAVTKKIGYLSYVKTDATGTSNLYRVRVDANGNKTEAEEQLTYVYPPARVVRGMISTGPAQVIWVVDKGDGYQEIWRQWYYGWPNNYPVEGPRLWISGAYKDQFGAVYCTEP